jgi:hypothetical protein
LNQVPVDWLVLPGHQYVLSDGRNPTFITVGELLNDNEALNALDSDEAWNNLEFLSFDDNLAEKARREKARSQTNQSQ